MSMTVKNVSKTVTLLIAVAVQSLSFGVSAAGDLAKQCQNVTQQQRQMAKAAGYDVDAACNSIKNMTANAKPVKNIQLVTPRKAAASYTAEGGVKTVDKNFGQMTVEKKRQTLRRYGYDLFAGAPTTFAPATDIPIPVDYLVGPGDTFNIQLLGKVNDEFELVVNRTGVVNFPELGPINVAGLKYSEAKLLVQHKVSQQMIGVRAVIALGELRSIRIFILGEAYKPGSYTVSSLSTMTNALFVSGGITNIGSLRNIQLKRAGKIITRLDLYKLLLEGDTSGDARLLPGDVIYIPSVGKTLAIEGEVKRPAIYEFNHEKNLGDLIRIAGGFSTKAYPNISHISRKNASGFSTVIDLDLTKLSSLKTQLFNGDRVEISHLLDVFEDVVELKGQFYRPRVISWKAGMTLADLIKARNELTQQVDLNVGVIIRKELPLQNIKVIQFSPAGVLKGQASASIKLQSLDQVITFGRNENRAKTLAPFIEQLSRQTAGGGLSQLVNINGNVRFPGTYPLIKGINVKQLVLLAGGLGEASYLGNAEITRQDISNTEAATISHDRINLADELSGKSSYQLQAKDRLSIYQTPDYREHLTVSLKGEVRFPGAYEFRRGETLSMVIQRAGGFTDMAHINASVFSRVDLRLQEAKQLKNLRQKMRQDIAASQLQDANAGDGTNLKEAEGLLDALAKTKALGRLVIQLDKIVTGLSDDIQLKDGDSLVVPTFRQEISVLGEVQHGSSHLFNPRWTLDDYLEKSGGVTQRADENRIYVVRADGSVYLPNQSGWLGHQNKMLNPGDTIVVPVDTDQIKTLSLWTNVSQIVYQLALGAAAVRSF
ncbi:MAG: SLBB domain-containing protein [Enterobacterales bacterium]|nr:SLBB domain-containing protein [Enterobacterales bacterium]